MSHYEIEKPNLGSIVYIGGYGRSGSTILDIIIGSHDRFESTGEMRCLFRHVAERRLSCSCGKHFIDCDLWSNVLECIQNLDRDRLMQLQYLVTKKEGWKGLLNTVVNMSKKKKTSEYDQIMNCIYNKLFFLLGDKYIIDSSKTAGGASSRPVILQKRFGIKIKLIHLTRDPGGVYVSVCKCDNEQEEMGTNFKRKYSGIKAIVGWNLANISCLINGFIIGRENYLRVKYEDLVIDPSYELSRIGKFLEVDMRSIIEKIINNESFEVNHIVGGNRMSRNGPVSFKKDIYWQRNLNRKQRFMIRVATFPLAILFGYRF